MSKHSSPFSANVTDRVTLVGQGSSSRDFPSTLNYVAQGGQSVVVRKDQMQDGTYGRVEMAVVYSKKLQNDLQELGLSVEQHEESIKFFKGVRSRMDESILDKHAAIGKYHTGVEMRGNENDPRGRSVDEIVEQVLKQKDSSAARIYQLTAQHGIPVSDLPATKDVVGIVATLCKVEDDNLCWLLAEYLGPEIMLALVCKTIDGVKALEEYDQKGLIDPTGGIHGLGASIGRHLPGRNTVICLENMRPYAGGFIADDAERRLDIRKPRLPSGETPPGFLGFAVNMISLESSDHFYVTSKGHGLRETLFYYLFSSLQVYGLRKDMIDALPFIKNGAVSLDGGIIKRTSTFFVGDRKSVDVKFPRSSKKRNLPENYFEIEKDIKEMKWKKERFLDDIRREQELLNRTKVLFHEKKEELEKFLHESETLLSQNPSENPR